MAKEFYDFEKRQRTFFLVINKKTIDENPELDWPIINSEIEKKLHPKYFCASCEDGALSPNKEGISDTEQKHIHVYLEFENAKQGTSIQKFFKTAHFIVVRGNPVELRDYVFKEGKHTDKKVTQIVAPFEAGDWDYYKDKKYRNLGDCLLQAKSKTRDTSFTIKEMVARMETVEDFILEDPALYQRNRYVVDKLYSIKQESQFLDRTEEVETLSGSSFYLKNVKAVYIYGGTGTGKTYGVQSTYGGENVSILTSYPVGNFSNMLYDDYNSTPVMVFDEFRSSIKISEMLTVLDRSVTDLRCRYINKRNLADKIFLLSNIPFTSQYKKLQEEDEGKVTFEAFERRFTGGIWFMYYSPYLKRRFLVCESEYLKEKYPQIEYDFSCPLANCTVISREALQDVKWLDEHYKSMDNAFMAPCEPDWDLLSLGEFIRESYYDVDKDEYIVDDNATAYMLPAFYAKYLVDRRATPKERYAYYYPVEDIDEFFSDSTPDPVFPDDDKNLPF